MIYAIAHRDSPKCGGNLCLLPNGNSFKYPDSGRKTSAGEGPDEMSLR